jgi:predicted metalloprotease
MPLIPESVMPHVRRFGWSGVLALAVVVVMLAGINPITVLTGQVSPPPPPTSITGVPPADADAAALAAYPPVVGGEAELMWRRAFRLPGIRYPDIHIAVVEDRNAFGCGLAGKDVSTFYCPDDATVYVDLDAYQRLRTKHPNGADYAQALLVAEAYGGHVQRVLGALKDIADARAAGSAEAGIMEKRLDMQSACYGAMWTKTAGIDPLYDNAAVLAALADVAAARQRAIVEPKPGQVIPELVAAASFEGRKTWYDTGYAIPAGGNCGIDKIKAKGSQ